MKKVLFLLLCIPFMGKAVKGIMQLMDPSALLIPGNSAAYNTGLMLGTLIAIAGSLSLCAMVLRRSFAFSK